ncbi:MAG: hypothetical protein Q7R81_05785 [Candidatus Peregrinibacteria bacterium]|nr:hypothetical protein [Candidatus Peregrinibacteria bacterium]
MDKVQKFLSRLDAKLRKRLERALQQLIAGEWNSLDVKYLTGKKGLLRCRVGQVRIIFARTTTGIIVTDIGFRGGMYKK